MIAAKNRIPIPEEPIYISISQIKRLVTEVNLQDCSPCEQGEPKLKTEKEILVSFDFTKLIDESK